MNSLRADTGIITIQVNDKGEYIQFSPTDNSFFAGFSDLLKWLEEQNGALSKISDRQKDIVMENGKLDMDALHDVLSMRKEISMQACEKIDVIFGEEASRKIFCGISPNLICIADFLEKVTPFIKKSAKERNAGIQQRYSRNRKGARSR